MPGQGILQGWPAHAAVRCRIAARLDPPHGAKSPAARADSRRTARPISAPSFRPLPGALELILKTFHYDCAAERVVLEFAFVNKSGLVALDFPLQFHH